MNAVVNAAKGWVNTPYHHHAKIKGVGVDCIQLVLAVHEEAGLVPDNIDTGTYTTDWHLHRNEDLYLAGLQDHLEAIDDLSLSVDARLIDNDAWSAPAGAVFVLRVGRTFSHGGIVTEWPRVIHASQPAGIVEEVDMVSALSLSHRPAQFYIHPELVP